MIISIGEDNGFLFGGVPTLVVVTVTFDNGKVVRFPYTADKAISALYEDLGRVNSENVPVMEMKPENQRPMAMVFTPVKDEIVPRETSNEIEREDIVTCVKVEDRGQGATNDLHVGGEYRVIKVFAKDVSLGDGRQKHIVDGYDVVDDSADRQFRTYVFAHEVRLLRKHAPRIKKVMTKEVDLKCSACGETTYCGLFDGVYTGKCDCGQEVSQTKAQWDIEHPLVKVAK